MKSCLLSGLLFYLSTIVPAFAQVNLRNGLVGCYPFTGNAVDLSVSANHGQVTGARLTSDRFGNPDAAYDFNGSSDHIEIPINNLMLNNFSYSLWVYPRRLPQYGEAQFLFSIGSDYGDQHVLFGDHYSNDRHTGLSHGSYLGVADNVLCSETSVNPLNKWYHLVLVRDDNNYTLYVDNKVVCVNSIQEKDAFYGTGTPKAVIGARNNFGQAADAVIDDIHLYDRPLNSAEVAALYRNELPQDQATVTIETSPQQVCAGDQLLFRATSSLPATTFEFYQDEWNTIISHNNYMLSNGYYFTLRDSPTDYDLKLTAKVYFDDACFPAETASATKTIRVKACAANAPKTDLLFVPDVFSPNADGKNDSWEIFNLSEFPDYEICVYSRWGEVIFQSKNYETPWNGIYKGKLVQPGTYTFKITSEKKLIKSGQLLIVH